MKSQIIIEHSNFKLYRSIATTLVLKYLKFALLWMLNTLKVTLKFSTWLSILLIMQILSLLSYSLWLLSTYFQRRLYAWWPELTDQFEEKYDEEDIIRLASNLPKKTPITIRGMQGVYPLLSKRQAVRVMHARKDLLRYKINFKSKFV